MPSRDQSGKEISGAEKNRRKKAAAENQRAREATGFAVPPSRQPLRYGDVPPPSLESTASLITYAARMLAVTIDQTALDPSITEEKRRYEIRDGCAKLGMVRDKAAEQESIQKLLKEAKGQKEAAGLDDVSRSPVPRVSRPQT